MSPTLEEVMGSYDWKEVMKYAVGFDMAAIDRVLYTRDGEPDGDAWLLLATLKTGGYGFVEASCDYTGWGCQEGGNGGVVETLEAAKERLLKLLPDYELGDYRAKKAAVAEALANLEANQ